MFRMFPLDKRDAKPVCYTDVMPHMQGPPDKDEEAAVSRDLAGTDLVNPHWTKAMVHWLAHVSQYASKKAAYPALGVTRVTNEYWRYSIPGFKDAEDLILGRSLQQSRESVQQSLTRALLVQASPQVAEGIIETATMSPTTAAEQTARLRASELVFKYAEIERKPDSHSSDNQEWEESIAIVAKRIRRARPSQALPPPQVEVIEGQGREAEE